MCALLLVLCEFKALKGARPVSLKLTVSFLSVFAFAAVLSSALVLLPFVSSLEGNTYLGVLPAKIRRVFDSGQDLLLAHSMLLACVLLFAALLLAVVTSFWRQRVVRGSMVLGVSMLVIIFAAGQWVLPAIARGKDPRPLIAELQKLQLAHDSIIPSFRIPLYAPRFYFNREIPLVDSTDDLKKLASGHVIARKKEQVELQSAVGRLEVIFDSGANFGREDRRLLLFRYDMSESAEAGP